MQYDKNFKRLFELDESMEIALVGLASELNCNEEALLNAICYAYLWKNTEPLKSLYIKSK